MAETTEAACLLQSGALYTKRVGLRFPEGRLLFAGIKRGAFSLYFDDAPIYHFDLEGRWQRAFVDGVHLLKSLDNAVVAIDRVREGANLILHRRELGFAEISDFDETLRQVAIHLAESLSSGKLTWIEPPSSEHTMSREEFFQQLDLIAMRDANAWFSHRERVNQAYPGEIFRTPEARQAIELHASWGGREDRLFETSARRPATQRSPAEFAHHVQQVAELLGRRAVQASAVYLGGADVLHRPNNELEIIFQRINEVFPIRRDARPVRQRELPDGSASLAGIDTFVDTFDVRLPTRQSLARLKSLGLRRITIGIESGAPEIREEFGARWEDDALRRFVSDAKAEDVSLGYILVAGAGGITRSSRHIQGTQELMESLVVGAGDLIYVIEIDELAPRSIDPARSAHEKTEQGSMLKDRLSSLKAKGAKVVAYSMAKQSL